MSCHRQLLLLLLPSVANISRLAVSWIFGMNWKMQPIDAQGVLVVRGRPLNGFRVALSTTE